MAMEQEIKDLGGLVNKDIGYSKLKQEYVYDSQNFRITTDEGGTLAVRTNIRGNDEILEIPATLAELELDLLTPLTPLNVYILSFTITNYTTGITSNVNITINYSGTTSFYDAVKTALLGFSTNPAHAFYQSQILIPFNYTKLMIRGSLVNLTGVLLTNITTGANVTSNISFQIVRPPQTGLKIIGWCTIRDVLYLLTTNANFDPDITPPPYNTLGQWWRLEYDKTVIPNTPSSYTLTMVYNGIMNVTIHRPVANPGMIEGRYENEDKQKIYWTDNFNVPRQINVAPSQDAVTATLTLDQLNLIPALNMEPPQITGISTGSLPAGVYQVIYRLKNLNNSETRFSRPSQVFPLLDASEAVPNTMGYYPTTDVDVDPPINTGKSIRVKLFDLNTEFTTVEIAVIYYKNLVDVPYIYIAKEFIIPPNGKIDTFITGGEEKVDITLEEATAFTTAIKRCKTLAAKKQTLFLGNLTVAGQKVDFDTRTYRFPLNSQYTIIWDASGNSYRIDANNGFKIDRVNNGPVTPYDVPEDHDCIQDYDMQDPNATNPYTYSFGTANYLYLPNSNRLGGEGPNLKYVFVTVPDYEIFIDSRKLGTGYPLNYNSLQSLGTYVAGSISDVSPSCCMGSSTSFDPKSTTPYTADNLAAASMQSPFKYGLWEGYMRDEMYRFGVVFYDVLDNPTYVNWTADIRMPRIYMPAATEGARYPGAHRLSTIYYNYGDGTEFDTRPIKRDVYSRTGQNVYAHPLGIKFTFKNTPADRFYPNASIVRTERKELDKRILGQGILRQGYQAYGCHTPINGYRFLCPLDLSGGNSPYKMSQGDGNIWTFHSPEFLNFENKGQVIPETKFNGTFNGDRVEIVSLYEGGDAAWHGWQKPSSTSVWKTNGGYGEEFNPPGACCSGLFGLGSNPVYEHHIYSVKHYEFVETNNAPYVIKGIPAGPNAGTNNPYSLQQSVYTESRYTGAASVIMTTNDGAIPGGQKSVVGMATSTFAVPGGGPPWTNPAGGGTDPCDGQWDNPCGGCGESRPWHRSSAIGRCLVMETKYGSTWNDFSVSGNRDMLTQDNMWSSVTRRKYIANYKRDRPTAYGGNTYFSRSVNEYIYINNFIEFPVVPGTVTTVVYGGDTVIESMDKVLDHPNLDEQNAIKNANPCVNSGATCQLPTCQQIMNISYFPVETSIPVKYRRMREGYSAVAINNGGNVPNRVLWFIGDPAYSGPDRIENREYFGLDPVYIHSSKSIYRFFVYNPVARPTETFDCRIWRSEEKIDGELVESWSIYRPGEYKDVESAYGPLNNLIIFQDKMYFIQDKGFGTVQVKEQKLISDASGDADLVLGSTGLLERYDYISTKTGTRHQFSMSVSDYSMIWFDTYAKKLYRYKPGALEPVSDVKGYHGMLQDRTIGIIQTEDNPYLKKGVHSTYDYRHNEFIVTFLNEKPIGNGDFVEDKLTLVYNDLFDGFVGEYTHYPVVYINDKSNFFSVPYTNAGTSDKMYVHNYGDYGVFYGAAPVDSKLSFIVNSMPTEEKVLTNFEFSSESYKFDGNDFNLPAYDDFFDTMRVYDSYQNTDFQPLANNARRHKSIWDIKVPSDRVLVVGSNSSGPLSIFNPANLDVNRPARTRRMKDRWFVADFTYDNSRNNKIILHTAKALYMKNSR